MWQWDSAGFFVKFVYDRLLSRMAHNLQLNIVDKSALNCIWKSSVTFNV